jgi:hypothetical protein
MIAKRSAVGFSDELCGAMKSRLVTAADMPQRENLNRLLMHLIVEVISRATEGDTAYIPQRLVISRSTDPRLRRDQLEDAAELRA